MVGWHHQLNGHEFKQTLGNGDGQGGLACCSPWGHKELDRTERLNNNNNKHLKESRPSGLRGTGRGRPGLGSKPHSTEPWSSLKVLRDLKDQGAGATMFDSFFFFSGAIILNYRQSIQTQMRCTPKDSCAWTWLLGERSALCISWG